MPRLAALISIFVLALTGTAYAQGAGDDQYQDPFGDDQSQSDSGGGSDGGSGGGEGELSDSPNVGGGSGSSGGGSSGSGSTGSGTSGDGTAGMTGSTGAGTAGTTTAGGDALPNTGSDPRILLLLGAAFVLTGAGLRLRTIDPDAF